MQKINLEEIIEKYRLDTDHYADQDFTESVIEKICLEFGEKLLELAAENAKTTEISIENWEEIDYESDFNYIPLMNEWEEIEGLNKSSVLFLNDAKFINPNRVINVIGHLDSQDEDLMYIRKILATCLFKD